MAEQNVRLLQKKKDERKVLQGKVAECQRIEGELNGKLKEEQARREGFEAQLKEILLTECELEADIKYHRKRQEFQMLRQQIGQPKSIDEMVRREIVEDGGMSEKIEQMGSHLGSKPKCYSEETQAAPRVVHEFPTAGLVLGVASLANELFVLRNKESSADLEVYDATAYGLLRRHTLPGVNGAGVTSMALCKVNRCLYIVTADSSFVHRCLLNAKIDSIWPTSDDPCYISVTPQSAVLITYSEARQLKEYTTSGQKLRKISLQRDIVNPYHAIQLPNGQFVICHGSTNDPVHRVCIVDVNGRVLQSYGGPKGSASDVQLNTPCHLAVADDASVFVADCDNRRVLLLSPTLSSSRVMVAASKLKSLPRRLCIDLERRRLYVAANDYCGTTAGRVLVVSLDQTITD